MITFKKLFVSILLAFFTLNSFNLSVFADETQTSTWTKVTSSTSNYDKLITRQQAFEFIWDYILYDVPASSKYIELQYTDLTSKDSKLYKALQKIVYIDALNNDAKKIYASKNINAYTFYSLVDDILWISLITDKNQDTLKNRSATIWDLILVKKVIDEVKQEQSNSESINNDVSNTFSTKEEYQKFEIMLDVYSTILNNHYNRDNLTPDQLLNWAISWMTQATNDQFTTYFPPADAESFNQHLSWNFEWIWAYIEMTWSGQLRIISPLDDSPAFKAWLKWWDVILKIDSVEVDSTFTTEKAASLIKWESWTDVTLTILREGKTFDVKITRAKVEVKDVTYKMLDDKTFYIEISVFWDKVFEQFTNALTELNKQTWVKKVIIDLRNNPGGYLDQVANMLSLFVPKWQPVAWVDYKTSKESYDSVWYNKTDLSKYDVYLLQNSGTASASEIMIWTLKDYFPKITTVWEKSYGKWSVQTITSYTDWSSFKYTIAKWFTWKTQTWIDHIWITPDIELKLDEAAYKAWTDNQLQYILTK